MEIGDLVKIQTNSLHFHEGKLGLVLTTFELPNKEIWYTVLIENVSYCFKVIDLEVISGKG